jgi:hypothetical protein
MNRISKRQAYACRPNAKLRKELEIAAKDEKKIPASTQLLSGPSEGGYECGSAQGNGRVLGSETSCQPTASAQAG